MDARIRRASRTLELLHDARRLPGRGRHKQEGVKGREERCGGAIPCACFGLLRAGPLPACCWRARVCRRGPSRSRGRLHSLPRPSARRPRRTESTGQTPKHFRSVRDVPKTPGVKHQNVFETSQRRSCVRFTTSANNSHVPFLGLPFSNILRTSRTFFQSYSFWVSNSTARLRRARV